MIDNKLDAKVQTRRHRTAERKGSLDFHNGKWRIVALVNGERIRKSTGTANREEAERIQKEFMAQFTARDAVAQAIKLADAVKTAEEKAAEAARKAEDALPALRIEDALQAYLDDFNRRMEEPTTVRTEENFALSFRLLCKWIAEHHPGCVEMRQFTPAMAEEYYREMLTRNAPSTCANRLGRFKRVWRILGEKARCPTNPWAKLKPKRGTSRRRENFTPEQVEAIFKKLTPGTELHTLCTLGRYTGLRLGDCATLKWSAVNFAENVIEVVPRKTKRFGRAVRIPIHEELRSVLDALPRDGELVLPEMARCYLHDSRNLVCRVTTLFKSAGLDTAEKVDGYATRVCKYGFHSFRHSFVSMCGERGVPLAVVQELVGHVSAEMTQHYFHLSDEAARKAIAALPGAATAPKKEAAKNAEAGAGRADPLAGLTKAELLALRDRIDGLLAK